VTAAQHPPPTTAGICSRGGAGANSHVTSGDGRRRRRRMGGGMKKRRHWHGLNNGSFRYMGNPLCMGHIYGLTAYLIRYGTGVLPYHHMYLHLPMPYHFGKPSLCHSHVEIQAWFLKAVNNFAVGCQLKNTLLERMVEEVVNACERTFLNFML
jgi:hypothetical protein